MGNAPSAPSAPSPSEPPPPPPPPLPPVCDLDCQRQKDLAVLKTALDNSNKTTDPSGYNKARVAYYTLLEGPGWLEKERQNLAQNEVLPILNNFNSQFDLLKKEEESNKMFVNLADSLRAQSKEADYDSQYLKRVLEIEKNKADVESRTNELNFNSNSYLPLLIDGLIALLLIGAAFLFITKFSKIKEMLGFSTNFETT
jgi:hypothetical protein